MTTLAPLCCQGECECSTPHADTFASTRQVTPSARRKRHQCMLHSVQDRHSAVQLTSTSLRNVDRGGRRSSRLCATRLPRQTSITIVSGYIHFERTGIQDLRIRARCVLRYLCTRPAASLFVLLAAGSTCSQAVRMNKHSPHLTRVRTREGEGERERAMTPNVDEMLVQNANDWTVLHFSIRLRKFPPLSQLAWALGTFFFFVEQSVRPLFLAMSITRDEKTTSMTNEKTKE